jgi:hypothetical protein
MEVSVVRGAIVSNGRTASDGVPPLVCRTLLVMIHMLLVNTLVQTQTRMGNASG